MKQPCSTKHNLYNKGKSTMKFWRLLSLTLPAIGMLGLMGTSYAANTDGTVTFTVNTANYTANYSPNNVAVVWVMDSSNRFVKTLCRHARTRINYLLQWNASRGSYTNVDGVTSSTLTSQPQTHAVTWNCRDTNNAVVPDGAYYFRVEYTSANGQGPYTTNWCKFVKGPAAFSTNYPNLNSSGGLFSGMSLAYTPAAPPAGDIAITGMTPATGIANSNVMINVTVSNRTAAASFSVTLSNVTATATWIGSQSINNLAGGATTNVTFNWNTMGLAAGSYQLQATAGPLAGEVNTSDNAMTSTVTLRALVHDVAVSSLTITPTVPPNVTTNVSVTVTNAGDFSETFVLSLSDLTAAQTIGAQTVSALASHTAQNFSFPWNTTNVAVGAHILQAVAAPVTGETSILNNSNSVTVAVTASGDIAVTGITPAIGEINSNLTIRVTVANLTASAASFSVTLSNVTSTAILIGSQQVTALAGGAATNVAFNWITTGLAVGSYQLKATAGPLVGEVNTANNVMTNTVTLRVLVHDIAVSSVTVAPTIPQNVVTNFIVSVTNAGDFSETFVLSCSDLTAAQTIGSQTISNLASHATTNVGFPWNTTNAALGAHVLRVVAGPVAGEISTLNNSNTVTVTVTAPDEINTLIARGSSWKYLDAGLDISGAPWTQSAVNYDDGFWASGPAPLGYGLPNIATTVNDGGNATNRYTTTYFRREFIVDFAPVTIDSRVRRADGVVLYLNGVEIARQNMPDGSVTYGSAASAAVSAADATNYFGFTVAPSNLIVGRNLLAAELHKSGPANVGLGFDLELSAVNPTVTRNYRVSPIAVQPDGAIQAGDVLGISITLTNQGNASTSFTILLKDAASGAVLASQQVGILAPGETVVVHLTWPTMGATTGSHTLQAVATYNGTTNVVDVPTVSVSIPPPSFTARKVNVAGSIGGRCNAVAVSGNYVYLGCGASLEIWDASQPTRPVKVGSLRLPGIVENLAAASGWVYAAAGASGVHIVDVRSPATPVHAATYDSSGHARRINLSGNRLYLADVLGGVRILDVSNPATPTLVGAYQTAGPAQAVAFSGPNLLVLDGHEGLQILQSSTPIPALFGALRGISGGLSLAAGSGIALAGDANGNLFRINIATPATPTVVTNVLLPAPGYSLALAGSALFVAAGPAGLLTLRSDTLATAAANAISGGDAIDVAVNASNTTLYVAAGFAGCQAWNISSTPLAPQPLAVFGNSSRPVDAAISGPILFVAGDESGLQVHSLTNLSLPTWLASVSSVSNARCVAVSGSQAFAADANGGLTILNVSNAATPAIVGRYTAPGLGMIRRLAVSGSRAALTDGKQIQLLSIANPAAPALIATNAPGGFVFDLAASTSHLFAACGGAGLRIFDLAGLNAAGSYRTPGPAVGVTINNAYAHVATGPNGWQTLDISNPAAPVLVQTAAGTTFGIAAAGPLVYTIDGQGGAQVVNVSAPLTPITARTFSSLTRTLRVSAAGRLILASEDEAGLALLSAGATNVNLSPTNLSPSCAVGQNATSQYFDVWSSGDGIMSYSIVAETSWLSVSPTSGTSTGEHNRIMVTYNTAALSAGTYSATITMVDSITLGTSARIPVTLTVSGSPTSPTLSVSVTSLMASCPVGQSEVSQSFEVWNSGGGVLTYLISDNADWLEMSPANGTSSGERDTIVVTFHAGDAGAGAHAATITVTSPDGAGSPKTIPVTLTVGAAAPILSVNPTSLAAQCTRGANAASQSVEVWNAGNGSLSYQISDDASWLSVSPTSGASTGEHDRITVTYNTATLAVGTYTAMITVTNMGVSGSRVAIPVTLSVSDGTTTSGVIVDNADGVSGGVTTQGVWYVGSNAGGWRTNYWHDGNAGKGSKSVMFRPVLPEGGDYGVYMWFVTDPNRAVSVPVDIGHKDATNTVYVNQRVNGSQWNLLGTYNFDAGTNGYVKIRNEGTSGYVIADAIKFLKTSDTYPVLATTPSTLSVSCTNGQNAVSQSVEIWNAGGGMVEYTLSDDVDWLTCDPTNGASSGEHDVIQVNYSTAGLAVGTYSATITVTAPGAAGSPQVIGVTLTVKPRPSVSLIVDNADGVSGGVTTQGVWNVGNNAGGWGTNYWHDGNAGKGSKSVRFRPMLAEGGDYQVYLWFVADPNRATNVPVDIGHKDTTNTVYVNQRVNGSQWNLLGTYGFDAGTNGYVQIRNGSTSGYVIADAVKFVSINIVSSAIAIDSRKAISLDMVASTAHSALDDNVSQFAVRWYSVAGRTYTIYRSTNLLAEWTAVQTVDATPPMNSYTDTTSSVQGYYMVVEQ